MSDNLLHKWTQVTAGLDWGKQRVLHDTLTLAAEGKIKVVYGADDYDGSPCLINAVGCMVKSQGETPMTNEPHLVRLFDSINKWFIDKGVNTEGIPGHMSPLAAEILVQYFAPLREIPSGTPVGEIPIAEPYFVEPSDAEIQAAWEKSQAEQSERDSMNSEYDPESREEKVMADIDRERDY